MYKPICVLNCTSLGLVFTQLLLLLILSYLYRIYRVPLVNIIYSIILHYTDGHIFNDIITTLQCCDTWFFYSIPVCVAMDKKIIILISYIFFFCYNLKRMMELIAYTLIHSPNSIIISAILYQDNKSDLVFLPTYYVISIIQHNN